MTLRPQSLPPVPEATVTAVQAAFPKGNLYVELRAEFGTLYDDQLFADKPRHDLRYTSVHLSQPCLLTQSLLCPRIVSTDVDV
jgi:hypothetical protein